APVREPSAPTLIGAPPPPCEANSAQETVPPPADVAAPVADAVVGAAAAAVVGLGAAGAAAGVELHAASTRANPLSRARRSMAGGSPQVPDKAGRIVRATLSHLERHCVFLVFF